MSLLEEDQPTDLEKMVGLSRRGFISAGALCGAAMFLGGNLLSRSVLAASVSAGSSKLLGFEGIAAATSDTITLPPGYKSSVLISWGQPLQKNGPAFDPSGNGTAAAQEVQFGDNNDGMSLFAFPDDKNRALMAINNEYTNYRYLYPHGGMPQSAEDVRKALASEGVSVIEVQRRNGQWQFVQGSRYNRRIHGNAPIRLSGPAAGHALMKTSADKSGRKVLGTFQNCANGKTPWGTYLTCEENFTDCFGSSNAQQTFDAAQKRYGASASSRDINWHQFDPRFDLAKNPNELNRHGWVVEIDPFDPQSKPIKRTALGRFKHENAALAETRDGRAVVYMGDDERGEFIYKFVSRDRINHRNPKANRDLLDHGTLYVAIFDNGDGNPDHPKGTGKWVELSHGKNGIDASSGFADQAEVLIHARLAASVVKATRMDRPEWIVVSPKDGQVYCTLTNNSKRGEDGQPVGGPNPREKNVYGQILRWQTGRGDHGSMDFTWDLFVVAGNPAVHAGQPKGGSSNITPQNMFNSPDGLGFDKAGRLWILTDGDSSNAGDFAGMGNNQMLCADPDTGEIRRFMVGPVGCEVTGITFSPDQRSLFVGIQHPGENGGSTFPEHLPNGKPRSSVMVITREDGGIVGA
ncbi:Putative phosphatase [Pseudomonas chlororaphis subsp. aurantiaca]|uniref:PhoX family phosphatase n=1 Tax=Pseudomonas chlororaphis subsp. aurantiaca TaxID=86192 RepID=A0AAJ0ZMC9_9PSED|nr:PhoX family phosphatase [Pseudomonas chlororaphis]AIS10657.1 transcriptional initiation protein Tat [Pseudomonas chlororaphis subsp. aurantiaca]AZD38577.1 Putative phosphatase [Pseudomonas chlororaphis subsp. aurantiaca]AZD44918.1 Putative phosphatase [Pseudomonas chlororaphis subsp. aurantiaca]AZD51217.1 Putative phosphatase [Pseudomonas chlororaphis subsp. aurantiaca]AZD57474.1 Putative phosphatase [Pseudomonas chlororaphis subsp. aurantiaca]